MAESDVWFRWNSKNFYSFATAQAKEVYREVSQAKTNSVYIAGGPHPSASAASPAVQLS